MARVLVCPEDGIRLARCEGGNMTALAQNFGTISFTAQGILVTCGAHPNTPSISEQEYEALVRQRRAEVARREAEERARKQRAEFERIQHENAMLRRQADERAAADKRAADEARIVAERRRVAQEEERKTREALAAATALLQQQAEEEAARRKRDEAARAHNLQRLNSLALLHDQFKVCVVGKTGNGKTTFINSFLGLRPYDAGAGKTGEGAEVTSEIDKYQLDGTPVVFLDVPGGFTPKHPARTYCQDHCIDLCDCIILCFHGRFTEIDIHVIQFALEHKIPILAAYTKSQFSVDNIAKASEAPRSEVEWLTKLKEDTVSRACADLHGAGVVDSSVIRFFFIESPSLLTGNLKFEEAEFVRALAGLAASRDPSVKPESFLERVLKRNEKK